MKKRKGSLLLQIAVIVLLMGILTSVIPSSVGSIVKTITDDTIKAQAKLLDFALHKWYISHSKYPKALTSLRNLGYISSQLNIDDFSYSTKDNQKQYRLTVVLKSGSTYISSGSTY